MAGYDPQKAAEYNRLIQQGLTPEEAIIQSGITLEEQGNYEIDSDNGSAYYGQMDAAGGNNPVEQDFGDPYVFEGQSTVPEIPTRQNSVNPASNPGQFPAYDDDGNLQPGFAINDETGDTYYRGFGVTRDNPVNPTSDPSQFPAYDDDGNLQPGFAINDELAKHIIAVLGLLHSRVPGLTLTMMNLGHMMRQLPVRLRQNQHPVLTTRTMV